jgi:hypothetical protein
MIGGGGAGFLSKFIGWQKKDLTYLASAWISMICTTIFFCEFSCVSR